MTEEELLRGEIKFYRQKLTELSEENKKLNKLREKYNEQYNIIKEQQAEIEKKDKIIDEMANNILQFRADTILPTDIEGIKRFFERKMEE